MVHPPPGPARRAPPATPAHARPWERAAQLRRPRRARGVRGEGRRRISAAGGAGECGTFGVGRLVWDVWCWLQAASQEPDTGHMSRQAAATAQLLRQLLGEIAHWSRRISFMRRLPAAVCAVWVVFSPLRSFGVPILSCSVFDTRSVRVHSLHHHLLLCTGTRQARSSRHRSGATEP
jgi:hypothetical protein